MSRGWVTRSLLFAARGVSPYLWQGRGPSRCAPPPPLWQGPGVCPLCHKGGGGSRPLAAKGAVPFIVARGGGGGHCGREGGVPHLVARAGRLVPCGNMGCPHLATRRRESFPLVPRRGVPHHEARVEVPLYTLFLFLSCVASPVLLALFVF